MAILRHEWRQGRNTMFIWTGIIAFMMALCILIYPEMAGQMNEVGEMFSEMGSFSAAFGMDKINFGEFIGFFGVECGNILGLGGAFFSALTGISALAKEEREKTAEFLLTHPISRRNTVFWKLCATAAQIAALNAMVVAISLLAMLAVGETSELKTLLLLFLAYFVLQIETAAICFGFSAFLGRGGLGIGLGIAALFYFINIIANLTEKAGFLKYLTPFGYAEGADIISSGRIDMGYVAAGILIAAAGITAAFWRYERKDIL